jgi:FixJ family two-component response regulator
MVTNSINTSTGMTSGSSSSARAESAAPSCLASTGPNAMPSVFVVDDDFSIRESLELLVQAEGWHAETFASAQEFLFRPRTLVPCCLVLDVELPELDGLELQKQVAGCVHMPIIFITGYGDIPMTVQAMKAGAAEFLTKPLDHDVLVGAIRSGIEQSRAILLQGSKLSALRACYTSLSPRECQVMELVVRGLSNKEVGVALGIQEITVKVHRGQVMRKMKAGSLPELVLMGSQLAPPA